MPLQKQRIQIPFAQGIDEKTTDKFVAPGKLLSLKNGVFKKGGSIHKRDGFTRLGDSVSQGDSTLANVRGLFTRGSGLYADGDAADPSLGLNERLWGYSSNGGGWADLGPMARVKTRSGQVPKIYGGTSANTLYVYAQPDVAVTNDMAMYVFGDDGGCYATVVDLKTGSPAFISSQFSNNGIFGTNKSIIRCVAVGNYLIIIEGDPAAGEIYSYTFDTNNPAAGLGDQVVLKGNFSVTAAQHLLDCDSNGTTGYCIYRATGAANPVIFSFNQSGVIATAGNPSSGAEVPVDAVSIVVDGTNIFGLYYNATNVRGYVKSDANGLLNTDLSGSVNVITLASCRRIVGVAESSGSILVVALTMGAADFDRPVITKNTFTSAGTPGTSSTLARSVYLASKPVRHNNATYLVANFNDVTQASYFLINSDGHVMSRFLTGLGPPSTTISTGTVYRSNFVAPSFPLIADGVYLSHIPTTETIIGQPVNQSDHAVGSRSIEFDFSRSPVGQSGLGGDLVMPGGALGFSDGAVSAECGFHTYPDLQASDITEVGGGTLSVGQIFGFSATYAWFDANGKMHESAPSPTITYTVVGAATRAINVAVPTLRLSDKQNVKIFLYMTQNIGNTLQIIRSADNDPTVDTVTPTQVGSPPAATSRIIYTNGGVLENIPPPSTFSIATRTDRVFVASERGRVFFSKLFVDGVPLEFNDALFVDIPLHYGEISAIEVMDGRLIALAERGIFFIDGAGPNNLGVGAFSEARDILSPVGAIACSPTALVPYGLLFFSTRGVELLGRDMVVQFIGSAVEDFVSGKRPTGIAIAQDKSEARFSFSDGQMLVLNYFFNQWSAFDGLAATNNSASSYWHRETRIANPTHVSASPVSVWENSAGSYSDIGGSTDPYRLVVDAAWIKTADIQGFQRIYEIAVLGQFKGKHELQIDLFYDYNETVAETRKVTVTKDLNPQQFTLQPKRQKCQAIKIKITETDPLPGNEGFVLDHLALEVGVKSGINKRLGKANTI